MATYPYPHSTAATYPPPIFTGGYYASPLPFYYGAPPAFPYPPPASAYAPPPGFFPTPAYGPSTFPSTATYPQPPPPSAYMTATAPAYDPSALLSTTTSSPDFPAAVTSPYSQVHAPPPESTAPPTPAPPTTGTAGSTPPSAQPWVVFSPSTGLDSVRFTPPPPAGRPATALLCCPDRGVPLLAESFSPTFSNATASSPVTSPFLGRTMTRDYTNMAKGPIEPNVMFALEICSARQFQQNQQLSRQIASSSGYGTMTMMPGITQGGIENSRMSYVPYNMGPSSGAGLVPQSANIGTSLPGEGPYEHVNTQLSLGMNPTHHSIVDSHGTNRILPKVTLPPTTTVKEVAKKPKFSCPICIDEIVGAASTVCGHVFCQKCIRTSIQTQRKCPTCRTKLNLRNFRRVYLLTTGLN